jgi:uncharacterized membrane-anchored protein
MSLFSTTRVLCTMAFLDVVIFGGWIAHEEEARSGEAIKLPLDGYDPRDLLSGHYVQVRLIAAREAASLAPHESTRVAVCLERGDDGLHHVTRWRNVGDTCAPFLVGTRRVDVDFGVDRFYVDERRADAVAAVRSGEDTYLLATVDSSGTIHPLDLVVAGKSLGRTGD